MTRVKLIYFKPSGKYYGQGEYNSEEPYIHTIFAEAERLAARRELPGLAKGHSDFHVVVLATDHEHDHPCLVTVEAIEETRRRIERGQS